MAQPRNIAKHPFRDYSIAGMMVAVNDGTGLQYLLTDHLGSTVAVTNASGTLTSQQRYLPFGAVRSIPNSPILGTDFTFTGQRDLGDMGLMDYDARFYSQSLGRFIQPDTLIPSVSIPQTWNRYSYTQNNPTRFVDPSGHFIETVFDVAMILVDVADIAKNDLNVSNGAALILDVAAVIIPGVPAVGGLAIKAAKAANAVDNAMDAAKLVNKVDNVADTAKATESLKDLKTFYRGDKSGLTEMISYAGKKSQDYLDNLLKNGDMDELMELHAKNSKKPPSPFLSLTTDIEAARFFAGPKGTIYKIATSRAFKNPFGLAGESEWLVKGKIYADEIIERISP
jgi:RHS repeat-associated protein